MIRPALAGQIPLRQAADAIASARTAALVDPDGESLAKCLAAVGTAEPTPHRGGIAARNFAPCPPR